MISTTSIKNYLAAEFQQPESRKHGKRTLPSPKNPLFTLIDMIQYLSIMDTVLLNKKFLT